MYYVLHWSTITALAAWSLTRNLRDGWERPAQATGAQSARRAGGPDADLENERKGLSNSKPRERTGDQRAVTQGDKCLAGVKLVCRGWFPGREPGKPAWERREASGR